MTETFTVEPLSAAHDRAGFSCGVSALDRYLRELATQDIRRRVSNCFVALDATGKIAGYYTFAATSLPLTELSIEQAKRLPRYPSFPACLIGRLAVDQRSRGHGLGASLIVDAIARAMRAEPAIFALIVDAKDEVALLSRASVGQSLRAIFLSPVSFFCPGSAPGRHLMGSDEEQVGQSKSARSSVRRRCVTCGLT